MTAYYNEIDPYAAQWLRNLIAAGHIAPGVVDERSITELQPDELKGYTQCHFFAGIGVWSHSLRAAGWDDSRPVWTGSCPCQPFSSAGKRLGTADERHLWPAFAKLIAECRPATVFGEQVASGAGRDWLAVVRADLEGMGYAVGAADLCAAGTGAPHIRQRLYWVADTDNARQQGDGLPALQRGGAGIGEIAGTTGLGAVGGLADAEMLGEMARRGRDSGICRSWIQAAEVSGRQTSKTRTVRYNADDSGQRFADGLDNPSLAGLEGHGRDQATAGRHAQAGSVAEAGALDGPSTPDGFWSAPDWLWCRDGKWRPVESGTEPLVTGAPARVGRLRAYGNALCAPVAEAFVRAYLASEHLCTPPVD